MDIVDTFNHLIPTEHLDDALFLGSNLENEVCEDFSTSQNVLEDSLKNMLSDKDPMLGSASNQFCLPVLDSNDPNFQMPCSTVSGCPGSSVLHTGFLWLRAERHTEVFMDIVDTFNHLIPTEHLDDALFLGSNLENEVCEDFSTSQNVLEDSLKNMLSDKDPMLGSASNQFCLPVLDSNDPNFQMPCSTG